MSPLKSREWLVACSGLCRTLELGRWAWGVFRTLFGMGWRPYKSPWEVDHKRLVYLIHYFGHMIQVFRPPRYRCLLHPWGGALGVDGWGSSPLKLEQTMGVVRSIRGLWTPMLCREWR